MTLHWYTVHSKPNQELLLWNQLQQREVESYFPRLRRKPVNPRARREVPYFPGYMFIRVDLENFPLSRIAWLPGMQRLVAFGGQPAWLMDEVLEAIRHQVEVANQIAQNPLAGLQPGDLVRITSGPFAGYEAIFDTRINGAERVRVLLKLLQRQQVSLEVPATELVRVRARC
jgi:transcription elongation factor/antiterminator RfaH